MRAGLIAFSKNGMVRGWAERSRAGRRLASRFVAGMTVEEAVAACERVNAEGIAVSLDSLGESVTVEAEARASAEVYHRLLEEMAVIRANSIAGRYDEDIAALKDTSKMVTAPVKQVSPTTQAHG